MNAGSRSFESLLSDDVFVAAQLASDVRSMWRRLARTQEVRDVADGVGSDSVRIRALCEFVRALIEKPYDKRYRHPKEAALCAALVILEQSPATPARHLFARLKCAKQPSLILVRRMAEYCDERFTDSARVDQSFASSDLAPLALPPADVDVRWSEPALAEARYRLAAA